MYHIPCHQQLSFEDFYLPFGGKLSGHNRWVLLAEMLPWQQFEADYAAQFSDSTGAPAKCFRLALGALIIKEKLGTSDRETVEQIRENPYLQYFLGFHEYSDNPPFDPSRFVYFRKRISLDLVLKVNELIVQQTLQADAENSLPEAPEPTHNDDDDDSPSSPPRGKLILDATCAPADIRYPTDLDLINTAREHTEKIIDQLHDPMSGQKKPRTYRRIARKDYLSVAKQRRPSYKQRRRGIKKQLCYLRRNLGHIDRANAYGYSLTQEDS